MRNVGREWLVRACALGAVSMAGLGSLAGGAAPAVVTAAADTAPTFTKDVAPILQAKCQSCHRPETVAPMSLLTYEEARPWARSIRSRVIQREMPPWHLDKDVGIQKFKNDLSLSDAEIATIVQWVDGGAPAGDPKDLPTPRVFADDAWTIGKPDLVVAMPTPDEVYAKGPDWWTERIVESGMTEDRYIKAVEIRVNKPGRKVVHHAVASLIQTVAPVEGGVRAAANVSTAGADGSVLGPEQGNYIAEYAVGKYGEVFPDGSARMMKAGAQIRFSMHYHAVGAVTPAITSVGFVFYPKGAKPTHYISDLVLQENDSIDIRPNAMARTDIYYTLPRAARVVGYQPHMHMRGKAMCMEALYPTGVREMVNCVSNFDFNWHIMYVYADDVAPLLPKGTVLHLIAIHDNTVANKRNPDPTQWIGWGQRSIDDMAAAHIDFQFLTDEDFQQQVAQRKAQQATTTVAQPH